MSLREFGEFNGKWQGTMDYDNKMNCINHLLKIFAQLAVKESTRSVPRLTLKSWRRLEVNNEQDYRNDGLCEKWEWMKSEADDDLQETWSPVLVDNFTLKDDAEDDSVHSYRDNIENEGQHGSNCNELGHKNNYTQVYVNI